MSNGKTVDRMSNNSSPESEVMEEKDEVLDNQNGSQEKSVSSGKRPREDDSLEDKIEVKTTVAKTSKQTAEISSQETV